jgi:hypothetical protein
MVIKDTALRSKGLQKGKGTRREGKKGGEDEETA